MPLGRPFQVKLALVDGAITQIEIDRLWYGNPVSAAKPLKYVSVSRSKRIVTDCFNILLNGFFRPFILEKS
jgi:hypothetical protein